MKKIVFFTQRVEIIESYDERRDCADQRISDFLFCCGYIPVPLPNNHEIVEGLMSEFTPSGIVLTGGNSLERYGGNAPERDTLERKLIEIAVYKKIPLLGFCRGMQVILDYFGYPLISVEGHVAKRHMVSYNGRDREVNSYHNQACVELRGGQGLLALASSEDGVIEAVKHESHNITGIMWHPEREKKYNVEDVCLFKELFGEQKEAAQ